MGVRGSASTNVITAGTLNRASRCAQNARTAVLVDARGRVGDQHRLDDLARPLVALPDHRGLRDALDREEHLLHLAGVDVEPVDDDDVGGPLDEVQVAVGVEEPDVGGAEPAFGVGAARAVGPVAGEEVGPADGDEAGVAVVELLVLVVGSSMGRPSASTSRSSTPGSARPTEPGLGGAPSGLVVTIGPASVSP